MNMTLSLCSLPISFGVWTLTNSYGETKYPFLKNVLNVIFLGELLTTNAFRATSSPTNMVPKSKLLVWLFLSSIIYLEWSTDVAWISMESFTRIAYDFSLMDPLNIPASPGLYLTFKKVSSWGAILRILGYTIKMGPWSWLNSIVPVALPLFFMAIFYSCSFPIFKNPISINGSKSIWLSIL